MGRVARRGITESEFLTQVLQLARLHSWRSFHARPGRTRHGWVTAVQGDGVGFPDVLLVRGPVLVAAEIKVGNNRLSPAQVAWLEAFRAAGVPAYCWRPGDWQDIVSVLAGEES